MVGKEVWGRGGGKGQGSREGAGEEIRGITCSALMQSVGWVHTHRQTDKPVGD